MEPAIIVHGGAGPWNNDLNRLKNGQAACEQAAQQGQDILIQGGSALDAVEKAVRVLEDSPFLNAGRGSYLNSAGIIEMDALIMDGRLLEIGAIAAVKNIRNPIALARKILDRSEFNMLVGSGAEIFAESIDFPTCNLADLLVEVNVAAETQANLTNDTVGAVAIDASGNLASATSTGGTRGKYPGRVGDCPLVGSGGYADNFTGAASATGRGEDLMKILISKLVCDFIEGGFSAPDACQAAVQILAKRTSGEGGIIAIDLQGRTGFAYNTLAMPHAFISGQKKVISGQ